MKILDLANKKTKIMTKKNTCSHILWAIHNNPLINPYDWKRKNEDKKNDFNRICFVRVWPHIIVY